MVLLNQNIIDEDICNLYKESFDRGYMSAGINLAAEYLMGTHCRKNYSKALTLLNHLYLNSTGEVKIGAAHNLGYIYFNGLGVERNKREAKRYLLISAAAGYEPSQELLEKIE